MSEQQFLRLMEVLWSIHARVEEIERRIDAMSPLVEGEM